MRNKGRIMIKMAYDCMLPIGSAAALLAAPFHTKVRETLRGRIGLRARWRSKAASLGRSPIWFHVSSVGEFEQARPLISALKERFPTTPIAVTFFSPSGYRFAASRRDEIAGEIDFIDYLPLDFAWNASFCLALLKPRLLVFVKFDLWPNLIWKARAMGIPVVLIDGTLSPSSRRMSAAGRFVYRSVYEAIDRILAISPEDAERFERCVPNHASITAVGDTRFDRVAQRSRTVLPRPPAFEGRRVLVAGSTWPPDEERLLPAAAEILGDFPEALLLVAPHEPTGERVEELLAWAESRGFEAQRFSRLPASPGPRVVVVDRVGILAELYRFGEIAYVGGAFSTGVHNVIEPAIMGIPVLFGPSHDNSHEAVELIGFGGAVEVDSREEMLETLRSLYADAKKRRDTGEKAGAYVLGKLGATRRCLDAISGLIT
jgi:3-deoxy-D-manno-octulosonic-acid transferase